VAPDIQRNPGNPKEQERKPMRTRLAKEPPHQIQVDSYFERGPATMGPWTSHIWRSDPRHLLFVLARYKFCSKALIGKDRVLEIGCGDAFGTPLVLQSVGHVHGIDVEPIVVEEAIKNIPREFADRACFTNHDILEGPVSGEFDAAYSLDMIGHIPPDQQRQFIGNVCASLRKEAVFIIGTPNAAAREHASPLTAQGRINLIDANSLKDLLAEYFGHTFIFSMNDEVVHTGYYPMAHYLLAIAAEIRL
jgi:2-polyprenyl-3-methyl-5-hydroxy-6-metoxy-1,4-benzoquinol methylase